jgi:3D (Asp-Asp-Asp) domain-containing protein
MQFLIPVLVGLLVLPASVIAPRSAEIAHAQTVATTTIAAPKLAFASTTAATTVFTAKLTAYNAVPGQTDNNPFTTASGAFSNPEVVAARSGDLASKLPFGTIIEITREGADTPSCNYSPVESQIGYRVIADAMNPRIVNTVDVLLDQDNKVQVGSRMYNPGIALGRCGKVTIRVVGKIAVKDIPATQAELALMVEGPAVLAQR